MCRIFQITSHFITLSFTPKALHHIYFCPLIFLTLSPHREPAPNPITQPLRASQVPITNNMKHCTTVLCYSIFSYYIVSSTDMI